MHLVRYAERATWRERVGVLDDGDVLPLPDVTGFAELLRLPVSEVRSLVAGPLVTEACPLTEALLLPPVDGRVEVWAAGVTYERSMDARIEETAASQDVYARVYDSPRPELFFKAPAWRAVTGGEPIGVRPDATVTVPEPWASVDRESERDWEFTSAAADPPVASIGSSTTKSRASGSGGILK